MSLPANIAQAILDTILGPLAQLFLAAANDDPTTAYRAASEMLSAHNAETEDELGLAAEIVSLQFHTLKALGEAFDPELPLNKVLRLRGGAVSLSRESHKARRRLEQLQRVRLSGATAPPAAASQPQFEPPQREASQTASPIETVREAVQTARKAGGQTWSQAFQQRQTAKRIADNLKKNQAEHAKSTAQCDEISQLQSQLSGLSHIAPVPGLNPAAGVMTPDPLSTAHAPTS